MIQWFTSGWGEVLTVLVITLSLSVFARAFFLKIGRQVEKTHNPWDDAFIYAARAPVRTGVVLVGLSWAMEVACSNFQIETPLLESIPHFQQIVVVMCLAWFLVRLISSAEEEFNRDERIDSPVSRMRVHATGRVARVAVIAIGVVVLLQTLGFELSAVFTFGGISGLVVGLAAKDLLSNFFGGLMIFMDKPFAVGDWVSSPDKSIEGTVEHIGWRLTTIRTFSSRPLYVPNAQFATISIENPSRMHNRRIHETLGVRYCDGGQLKKIVNDVEAMLKNHPDIAQEKTIMVNFSKYAASSLEFFIYCFTSTTAWAEYNGIKQDVLFKIMDIVEANGAEFAFPTQTVFLEGVSETRP